MGQFIDDKERGLYEKFAVDRADGRSAPGEKHEGCEYFVLDLDHDPFAVHALRAYANLCRRKYPKLSADLVKKIDRIVLGGEEARISNSGPITIPSVIASVERFYHIEPGRLSSRSRVRTVLGPRQVAMYLCRHNTIASYAEIGRAFNRNHPSVVNAFRNIADTKDLQLIQHVAEIQRRLDAARGEGE